MIVVFTVLVIGLIAFEIWKLWGKGMRREMATLIGLALVTLTLGYLFILNPFNRGIARIILDLQDRITKAVGG